MTERNQSRRVCTLSKRLSQDNELGANSGMLMTIVCGALVLAAWALMEVTLWFM